MKNKTSNLRAAALCAILSVLTDFILIPQVLPRLPQILRMILLPDPIWMALMILFPVGIAIWLLEQRVRVPARYVWLGLPVQYLILIVFAEPISCIGGWGDWTYIWDAFIWPICVVAAQFAALVFLRKWKIKRGKEGRAG